MSFESEDTGGLARGVMELKAPGGVSREDTSNIIVIDRVGVGRGCSINM